MNKFLLAIAALALLTSCEKDENDQGPAPDPIDISISQPTDGAMVMPNDTLQISSTITALNGIHEYSISIYSLMMDSVVHSFSDHSHADTLQINEQWINTMPMHSDMMLRIYAEDHNGAEARDSVAFHAHH